MDIGAAAGDLLARINAAAEALCGYFGVSPAGVVAAAVLIYLVVYFAL